MAAGLVLALAVATVPTWTGWATARSPSGRRGNSALAGVATGGGAMRTWVAANMAGGLNPSTPQAVLLAQQYNVIVANPGTFAGLVGAMKAVNPGLAVYAYLNGTYSSPGGNYPASWYAHDARGGRVVSVGFGNFLMDPTNPGWIGDRSATCRSELASSGYDGCFLDMLGPATMFAGYDNALPIDPTTGQPWTMQNWLQDTAALAGQVKADTGVRVIGNGLASGNAFYDPSAPSSVLLGGIDGASAEIWMRQAGSPVTAYPALPDWQANVNMLSADPSASVLTITKTWTGGSQAQKDAWHKFALASFLLGTNGNDYFEFSSDNSVAGIVGTTAWDHVNIGNPTSGYGLVGGAYARDFTNGIALVNPGTTTVTVRLGGTFVDLAGVARTSVTLTAHAAEVLVGSSASLPGLPPGQPGLPGVGGGGGPGGYRMAGADGAVYAFGSEAFAGSTAGRPLTRPVVGMAATPSALGYWLVASDGGIFTYGGARFCGSAGGIHLNQPIVGMAATPDGGGYWLVASDGGIFTYGDARFYGSAGGTHLNQPIVGMAATPDGGGYWLVARDGGIFSYGDAHFSGSAGGTHLNQPIVGMAATPDGGGYWLVASDGGIFTYGDARFYGSAGGTHLNRPIVAMAGAPSGNGYWLVASDGGLFTYGAAPFFGSAGATALAAPVVGISR